MANYYVNDNAQNNGDHEVHREGCRWLALAMNTTSLGNFTSCHPAVAAAKRRYRQSNGCATCSPNCHTS